MSLWCQEEMIGVDDEGKRAHCGDSEVYETAFDKPGDLYRASMRHHGRCISKVYVDDGVQVGWVFVKRMRYEDDPGTFLAETWVTVHTAPPTTTVEYHYLKGLK